jgi:hypothetical protein
VILIAFLWDLYLQVSRNLLMYSYVIAGSAEMICAMFAYFMVYVYHGIPIANLAFSADTYFKDVSTYIY